MLQKQFRLTKRKMFGYIYKNGVSKSGDNMVLLYTPAKAKSYKVGFSVSKKIGKAHTRNLIKRRLRESFKLIMPQVSPKFNYVIVAKPNITDKTFNEIHAEMLGLYKKSGMIINE